MSDTPDEYWTDWSGSAMSVIRAALAEGVVAEHSHALDPDTRWLGGTTRHRDVIATVDGQPSRRDAKSVRIENGQVVIARWNAKPFSVTDVDFITLVLLGESSTGFKFDLESGTATMHGEARIETVWDVPTAVMNSLMRKREAGDPTWRNVHVDEELLNPYRVL
jgi:hypothetical protein